jgi:hypothetical protein
MYLEAVVVCVNYSDFLAHTLPANRAMFDNMVVVTDTKDKDTFAVCNKYNVRCVQTDAFYADGAGFNKASGINEGLKALNQTDWVVHLDADILLPPLTRHILEKTPLDPTKIYGIDRLMCPSYAKWMQFYESTESIHQGWAFTHLNYFPGGSRLVQYGEVLPKGEGEPDGWVPIGFFQMWRPQAIGNAPYPEKHAAADRTDVQHAKRYDRAHRELLPEIIAIHLDSEPGPMGINWSGRKTARFGFQPPEAATITGLLSERASGLWQRLLQFFWWLWLVIIERPHY